MDSVLTSTHRNEDAIESVQTSVNGTMEMIAAMREQMEDLKRMDKSLIMRTFTE
jgi:hypothetical protein